MHTQSISVEKKTRYSTIATPLKVEAISTWLEEKKAIDLVAIDLSGEAALCEATIIVTATSVRHAQGLADFVLEECRREKFEYLRMEGYNTAQWILLDLNDVVVHIFQPESRDVYRLDDLWPAAKVLADHRKEG